MAENKPAKKNKKPKVKVTPEDYPLKEEIEQIMEDVIDEPRFTEPLDIPIDTVEEALAKIEKSDSFSVEFSYCTDCGEPASDDGYMKIHMLRFHPPVPEKETPGIARVHEGEVIQRGPMPPAAEVELDMETHSKLNADLNLWGALITGILAIQLGVLIIMLVL